MSMSMHDRMVAGELYRAADDEIQASHDRARRLVERFNLTTRGEVAERGRLLGELFGHVGEDVTVLPRIEVDHGDQVSIGDRTFVNYGAVFLDGAPTTIGSDCQIATNVQLITATHPIDPGPRRDLWEYCLPVTLADNVWLGAGVIVCPGVSIGADSVIGAGSVVVKDIPAGVVAVGNPARVLREIGPGDTVDRASLPADG